MQNGRIKAVARTRETHDRESATLVLHAVMASAAILSAAMIAMGLTA